MGRAGGDQVGDREDAAEVNGRRAARHKIIAEYRDFPRDAIRGDTTLLLGVRHQPASGNAVLGPVG